MLPINPFGIVQQMIIKEASKNTCMLNRVVLLYFCRFLGCASLWLAKMVEVQTKDVLSERRARPLLVGMLAVFLGSACPIPKTSSKYRPPIQTTDVVVVTSSHITTH